MYNIIKFYMCVKYKDETKLNLVKRFHFLKLYLEKLTNILIIVFQGEESLNTQRIKVTEMLFKQQLDLSIHHLNLSSY